MGQRPRALTRQQGQNPSIPLVNLPALHRPIDTVIQQAIQRVFERQQFILGPEVEEFEQALARYCDAKHGLGCASGTDALLLALAALNIGPGAEVITTPYSFFSTAGAIRRTGARPVFVDIQPDTFNLDIAQVEAAITRRTRAILPVHLFGQCAEMDPIWRVSVRHHLAIIEDAAQGFGAEYRGRQAGVLGTLGCFSFFPTKNLGAMGDAGGITTDDPELASRIRRLRVHGLESKSSYPEVGINSRLDTLQAAILLVKLPLVKRWIEARRRNAQRYAAWFEEYRLLDCLTPPASRPDSRHTFNQYVIRVPVEHRDALREHLLASNIGCEVYYPVPLHLQPCFAELGYRPGSLPAAEQAAQEALALPIHPALTAREQEQVVQAIAAYFGRFRSKRHAAVRGPKFLRHRQAEQTHPLESPSTSP